MHIELRGIARLIDKDEWRQKLRDVRVAKDAEALERLALEKNVLEQPPPNLLILGRLLDKANARESALQLLRRAQNHYPTDFWLSFELANVLSREPETAPNRVGRCRRPGHSR